MIVGVAIHQYEMTLNRSTLRITNYLVLPFYLRHVHCSRCSTTVLKVFSILEEVDFQNLQEHSEKMALLKNNRSTVHIALNDLYI